MSQLEQHEIFEMEVLERLKNVSLLQSLVFGGCTMLRLCHDLPRYSVYFDFLKAKEFDGVKLLKRFQQELTKSFEITDAQRRPRCV
ncbi:MAG: nucleotidyl transferase AbiEii/AbiGii toxin family protein [Calditrichaeota bacterium]|nr:nucleotidyl transferase AbiEii/AbiGii toxin family protein [Calditrichota bacterium]